MSTEPTGRVLGQPVDLHGHAAATVPITGIPVATGHRAASRTAKTTAVRLRPTSVRIHLECAADRPWGFMSATVSGPRLLAGGAEGKETGFAVHTLDGAPRWLELAYQAALLALLNPVGALAATL